MVIEHYEHDSSQPDELSVSHVVFDGDNKYVRTAIYKLAWIKNPQSDDRSHESLKFQFPAGTTIRSSPGQKFLWVSDQTAASLCYFEIVARAWR